MAGFADVRDGSDVQIHAPAPVFAGVVGGDVVPDGAWPDAAALVTADGQLHCTGVLIAPDLVLTAGHCGFGNDHVVLGTADYAHGGETVAVVDSVTHEDYLTTLDVAVLRLERPVTDVAPRVLARDCVVDDDLYSGANVSIVGFGATDRFATEFTTQLHEADTTIDDPECTDLYSGCNAEVSPGGELTAGGDGVDSCSGDSGGPLYLRAPDGDFLAAITSRAETPADTLCGDGGIYVRADALAGWVEQELSIELPRPACDGNRSPAPTSDPLVAVRGKRASVEIDPHDPDPDQSFAFSIVVAPAHGEATVDEDGTLTYDADGAPLGDDAVTVAVTDDGDPPRTGRVVVPITVVPVPPGTGLDPDSVQGGCGCDSTALGSAWGFGLVGLIARRRRLPPSDPRPPGR